MHIEIKCMQYTYKMYTIYSYFKVAVTVHLVYAKDNKIIWMSVILHKNTILLDVFLFCWIQWKSQLKCCAYLYKAVTQTHGLLQSLAATIAWNHLYAHTMTKQNVGICMHMNFVLCMYRCTCQLHNTLLQSHTLLENDLSNEHWQACTLPPFAVSATCVIFEFWILIPKVTTWLNSHCSGMMFCWDIDVHRTYNWLRHLEQVGSPVAKRDRKCVKVTESEHSECFILFQKRFLGNYFKQVYFAENLCALQKMLTLQS
jgi:hypothetical protein